MNNRLLIYNLYSFTTLSYLEQQNVVTQLSLLIDNKSFGWPNHRTKYILPLCQNLLNNTENIDFFAEIQNKFSCIRNQTDLDLCLMFWQITKDVKYFNIIKQLSLDTSSPINNEATCILNHYHNYSYN